MSHLEPLLHLLGRIDDDQFEAIVLLPRQRCSVPQSKEPVNPLHVSIRAHTAELSVQVDLEHVGAIPTSSGLDGPDGPDEGNGMTVGGMGRRRVLVHASGFKQSPYADVKPAGDDTVGAPSRKLWHRSPGSAG